MIEKTVVILRGCPGAGKSSFAKWLKERSPSSNTVIVSTDHFFEQDGKYLFDPTRLKEAIRSCYQAFSVAMRDQGVDTVIVDNTNTRSSDFAYFEFVGRKHGFKVVHLIVENRHGSLSLHNVPYRKVREFADRFQVQLI